MALGVTTPLFSSVSYRGTGAKRKLVFDLPQMPSKRKFSNETRENARGYFDNKGRLKSGKRASNYKMKITIDPSPIKVAKLMGIKAKDFGNFKPIWDDVSDILTEEVLRNHKRSSSGPVNPRTWWDQVYARRKKKKGKGTVEDVLSGKLLRDLTAGKPSVYKPGASKLVYGSALDWANSANFDNRAILWSAKYGWGTQLVEDVEGILNKRTKQLFAELSERINKMKSEPPK